MNVVPVEVFIFQLYSFAITNANLRIGTVTGK